MSNYHHSEATLYKSPPSLTKFYHKIGFSWEAGTLQKNLPLTQGWLLEFYISIQPFLKPSSILLFNRTYIFLFSFYLFIASPLPADPWICNTCILTSQKAIFHLLHICPQTISIYSLMFLLSSNLRSCLEFLLSCSVQSCIHSSTHISATCISASYHFYVAKIHTANAF